MMVEMMSPAQRRGRANRRKGAERERQLVAKHIAAGVHAERVPLSGASRYQGNGSDVDVYAFGKEASPIIAEVKARAGGSGFTTIEKWLGESEALFLIRDQEKPGQPAPAPMVVLPWETWLRILERTSR